MKTLLIEKYDIVYLIIAGVLLIADFSTTSEFIEASTFILILIWFIFTIIPKKKYIKDERINFMKYYSGYITLMLVIIIISIFSGLYRYTNFKMETADLLRYTALMLYYFFFSIYTIVRRIM